LVMDIDIAETSAVAELRFLAASRRPLKYASRTAGKISKVCPHAGL